MATMFASHSSTWQPSSTWNSNSESSNQLNVPRDSECPPTSPRSPGRLLRGRLQSFRRATSPSGLRSKTPSPENSKGALGLTLLHDPSEPRVDFIFVHGLNGGSKRSWSFSSDDPSSFWPKEWLPSEAGFKHVRIHSFGYDSDWTKSQQSSLTIHDFGQALLADLYNSPHLKKNGNTPIVLVAHSMGGLVVKKAYLLARRDPIYADIASRIHTLYFLGTPHRGADSSTFVNTFISMNFGSGSKAFVKELIPGSGTLQAINDEFRHVCGDVGLWSFFEGVPTAAGPTTVMVVEKESAVMGLPGEHTQYLQADHRRLVKFESTEDPNYNILLRCFNTTIEAIEKEFISEKSDNHRAQMKQIASAFDVGERPDGDFIRAKDKLHTGSCEWLTSHPSFQEWLECDLMDSSPTVKAMVTATGQVKMTPRFLWLHGPPGSGKSVASGHVIQYLESFNLDCAYFFFKNNEKPSLTQLLLSLAMQMAESNFQIRHTFLSMIEEGEVVDSHSDHVLVWNSIFLGRIFKLAFSQPQYWVIDALDECSTRLLNTLLAMLSRIEQTIPLRIFITSRPNGHVERLLNQERVFRNEIQTGQAESLKDIEAFVRSRLSPSIIDDFNDQHDENEEEKDLVQEIITKSNGIFLWASLIMTRLEDAHSIEAMRATMNSVPREMSGMYSGILEGIIQSPNAELAHCILRWVVCARKPLTTDELREVVRLDINQTLRTSDRFAQICGNLITIDDNYVQVMHQTVKEFLTGEQSDYYIPRSWSHARIAELCLQHLNGKNFNPPRTRRAPSKGISDTSSSFDDYAATNFSYHLAHCSPSESTLELLPLLATFFSNNVLAWIERIARTGRLALIMRTIQNLKMYLDKQVATSSPIDSDYQLAVRFTEDLIRMSAIYGPNLVATPSSIYSLVPLLCPKSSIIHWKFGKQFKQKVLCQFNNDWDERLSSLTFGTTRVLSIAGSADQFFAVGLQDGTVKVYRQNTFELLNTLKHGEPVRKMANGNLTGVLATAGLKTVKVWGPRQVLLWSANVPEQPLSLEFSADDSKVYVPIRSGEVLCYRTKNGARLDSLEILDDGSSSSSDSDSDYGDHQQQLQKRTMPMMIRLSPMLGLAAIVYRSSHLQISYYDSDERVEVFEKEGYEERGIVAPQILDVTFNTHAEQNLMAVAYQDGDLITLDPWTLQQKNSVHINAHTLAASPDGQTLAAGDSECVISLFAFDGLRLLCRIESAEERIMGIVFASSSLRFFDLRGNTCNVWEPAVLIKKNLADDSSSELTDEFFGSQAKDLVCTRTFEGSKEILVMTQAADTNFVFCGREEGSITLHDISTGKVCAEFNFHAKMVDIRHLEWNSKANVLLSVDASRRCIFTRLALPSSSRSSSSSSPVDKLRQQNDQMKTEQILDFRASDTVLQALISPDGSHFLVSTHSGEELLNAQGLVKETNHSLGPARWLQHPTDADRLLLFDGDVMHIFLWKDLVKGTPESGTSLQVPSELFGVGQDDNGHPFSDEWYSRSGSPILYQTVNIPDSPHTGFLSLDLSTIGPDTTTVKVDCTPRKLISHIRSVLGVYRSNLYFMSGRGWVCSISLKNLSSAKSYTRHFFIPSVWQTGSGTETIAKVVNKTTVAMAHRDEIAVLSRFLEFKHKTAFADVEEEKAVVPVIRMS